MKLQAKKVRFKKIKSHGCLDYCSQSQTNTRANASYKSPGTDSIILNDKFKTKKKRKNYLFNHTFLNPQ